MQESGISPPSHRAPLARVRPHSSKSEVAFSSDDVDLRHERSQGLSRPDTLRYWSRIDAPAVATAAAAAAPVAVVAVVAIAAGKWKTTCSVLLSFLTVVSCSHFSLSLPATCSVSRVSRAALVAARHTRRRPRAVLRCGPLSTRIHQAFFHHVMCLFNKSCSSCIEFISFFSSTHSSCVVNISFPSCPSWALSLLRSS